MLIRAGRLVAFPTETVYGLGADATNDDAVAAVFAAKDRPRFNPLIIHFPDGDKAGEAVVFDGRAERLAKEFWPGALTLVLPRRAGCGVSLLAGAGLDTLAVRVPNHPVALDFLCAAGRPLAAPSANKSGMLSPTLAIHVLQSLGESATAILDGGPCRVGIESTVLDLTGGKAVLLRPGGIPAKAIEAVIGPLAKPQKTGGAPKSPGMGDKHYAPRIPLRLNVSVRDPGEALLGFGPDAPRRGCLNLSRKGDMEEAAANLFAMIHALDQPGFTGIAVMPIPDDGLGAAINDRLRRAARP